MNRFLLQLGSLLKGSEAELASSQAKSESEGTWRRTDAAMLEKPSTALLDRI